MTNTITAALVKELRTRTGAGMMECKRALTASAGDIDAAIEAMRIAGLARADNKSDRVAAQGVVAICVAADRQSAAMVEVNCETDFVAGGRDFLDFSRSVAEQALTDLPPDAACLLASPLAADGSSVNAARKALISKLGENVQVRRLVCQHSADGTFSSYSHGGRIGVLVCLAGGDASLAKDIAMHIAASRPEYIAAEDVPATQLDQERAILIAKEAADADTSKKPKPAHLIDKIVAGRIKKYLAGITLMGQPFVKDPGTTVGQLLQSSGATVTFFQRLEVGEGIEQQKENFADEVMAQVRAN